MEEAIGTSRACQVLGKSRATVYRQRNPVPATRGERAPFRHPAELPEEERAHVLAVLDSPRFADKSPGQVWAILLDEGTYLCSEATMYRLLRERGQSGERRARAACPAKKKPELMADAPNQAWSWDITKLKGPARGIFYLLYVIIDIFSRKVIWRDIWPHGNRHSREGVHRARHRRKRRDQAWRGPCRPGNLDDLEYRRRPARDPRNRPIAFPAARIQR
jgi:putative transposase